jgi:hypothetical protein
MTKMTIWFRFYVPETQVLKIPKNVKPRKKCMHACTEKKVMK